MGSKLRPAEYHKKHESVREEEEQSQNGRKERESRDGSSGREEILSSSMSAGTNQQALNAF